MSSSEDAPGCYTHSREFSYEGDAFRLRINDDRMTYTATVWRDGEPLATVTDLGPEAARWSHATLAEELLG
ncbi:MAG: hypothetical protein QXG03_00605 [Halalkalicoccus sp.]